ncbi:MAG TPA: DUF2171 domain-containing protein [Sphingomonas sp.]|nr:DUF2171 domain-containing protein [Sphingomonas sp.]
MAYDRDDTYRGRGDYGGRYGNDYGRREERYDDRSTAYAGQRDYQRPGGDHDRGFFDRAGDEVRSWFGDDEAERRRARDTRYDFDREDDRGGYSNGAYGDRNRDDYSRGYARDVNRSSGGYGRPGGFMDRVSSWFDDGDRGHGEHSDYHDWRTRQMRDLDRDYHEYRRESQSKFDNDFGTWRRNRQTQRGSLAQVEEHFDVVGSDGEHVGTVDKVRGDTIILTKSDSDAGGHHHSIPSSWLRGVEGKTVTLTKTAAEAKRAWREADDQAAMFGDSDKDQGRGAHILNRSFSGTY